MKPGLVLAALLLAGCYEPRLRHQVNPGARVPIYVFVPVSGGDAMTTYNTEAISFRGLISPGLFLHEFVHLVEHRLIAAGDIDGARIVRHAFRDLCSPAFEMGRKDLLEEIP